VKPGSSVSSAQLFERYIDTSAALAPGLSDILIGILLGAELGAAKELRMAPNFL
jgi:hypothetical protein